MARPGLEDEGFVVMRFWNAEVLGDLDMVLATIASHLDPGFDRFAWSTRQRRL